MGNKLNKLETRCLSMCGVISCWQTDIIRIKEVLNQFFTSSDYILHYYYIFHDDEVDNLHYHYVIRLNKAVRCSTMLNSLDDFFASHIKGFDRNQISVDRLTDLNAYLRYFIHLDYEDKKPYFPYQICSDETLQMIEGYINSDNCELTAERLISYVINSSTIDDLMISMGLKAYHKYRYEISQLWDNKTGLLVRYKHLKSDRNDLPF